MFFLFLSSIHNNPFDTFLATVPADGKGLNPLLPELCTWSFTRRRSHRPRRYDDPFAFAWRRSLQAISTTPWLRAVRRGKMFADSSVVWPHAG